MKFADHLSKETNKKLNEIRSSSIVEKQPEPTPKKKTEQLSRKDIEELMGMNRDRFGRGRGGSLRRK